MYITWMNDNNNNKSTNCLYLLHNQSQHIYQKHRHTHTPQTNSLSRNINKLIAVATKFQVSSIGLNHLFHIT